MAAFEVRLVAVGAEDVGVAEHAVIGDEGEAAVAGGVVADLLELDVVADGEAAAAYLAVAGVGSRTPDITDAVLAVLGWLTCMFSVRLSCPYAPHAI